MKIACLGWGSLVWESGSLLCDGEWRTGGPIIPIEYARVSSNGRLTLVITDSSKNLQSLWTQMRTVKMDEAIESLRSREGILQRNVNNHIGVLRKEDKPKDSIKSNIIEWLNSIGYDAVIYTNLPPKFNDEDGKVPTEKEVIEYLSSLKGEMLEKAKQYIQYTPSQIQTEYRRTIEKVLGWSSLSKI